MNTKEMIIKVAREEFILNGYSKASLRTIASKCNITATALYRHFKNKEDLFMSVIDPFISNIKEVAKYIEETDYKLLEENNLDEMWNFEENNIFHFKLLFEGDKELVKLIIAERREWLLNFINDYEYASTIKYINKMKELGFKVNEFDSRSFRILLNSYLATYFDILFMDLDNSEAFDICKDISDFYKTGFRNLLGF